MKFRLITAEAKQQIFCEYDDCKFPYKINSLLKKKIRFVDIGTKVVEITMNDIHYGYRSYFYCECCIKEIYPEMKKFFNKDLWAFE